jgi:hypothetical protein
MFNLFGNSKELDLKKIQEQLEILKVKNKVLYDYNKQKKK